MEIKFDVESFIALFVSIHEVLTDFDEELSVVAYDSFNAVYDSMKSKLISLYESECDSN